MDGVHDGLEWHVDWGGIGTTAVGGTIAGGGRVSIATVLPESWTFGRLTLSDSNGSTRCELTPYRQPISLRLPLEGEVLVAVGHGLGEVHRSAWDLPSQRFAWDFVPLADDGLALLNGPLTPPLEASDFAGFGRPVFAPAAGKVLTAEDGHDDLLAVGELPDRAAFAANPVLAAGNHVVVEHDRGVHSVVAHLRQGSVRAGAGTCVEAGDVLGEVGNSGFSSGPHLHVHFMDGPDLRLAAPLPVAFALEDGERDPRAGEIVAPA